MRRAHFALPRKAPKQTNKQEREAGVSVGHCWPLLESGRLSRFASGRPFSPPLFLIPFEHESKRAGERASVKSKKLRDHIEPSPICPACILELDVCGRRPPECVHSLFALQAHWTKSDTLAAAGIWLSLERKFLGIESPAGRPAGRPTDWPTGDQKRADERAEPTQELGQIPRRRRATTTTHWPVGALKTRRQFN